MICLGYRTPSAALHGITQHGGPYVWYGFTIGQWFIGVMRRTR